MLKINGTESKNVEVSINPSTFLVELEHQWFLSRALHKSVGVSFLPPTQHERDVMAAFSLIRNAIKGIEFE